MNTSVSIATRESQCGFWIVGAENTHDMIAGSKCFVPRRETIAVARFTDKMYETLHF